MLLENRLLCSYIYNRLSRYSSFLHNFKRSQLQFFSSTNDVVFSLSLYTAPWRNVAIAALISFAIGMLVQTYLTDLIFTSPHLDAKVNKTFESPLEEPEIFIYADFKPPGISSPGTFKQKSGFNHGGGASQNKKEKYVVAFFADDSWRKDIDAAVNKLSENFRIVLIRIQLGAHWDKFEWLKHVEDLKFPCTNHWLSVKMFLHPWRLASYEYVVIWCKDLEVEDFDAEEYIKLMKKHHIGISHPGVELHKKQTSMKSKEDFNCETSIFTMSTAFSRDAWVCFWDMFLLTDKFPRPDDEKPAQGKMPDADVVDRT